MYITGYERKKMYDGTSLSLSLARAVIHEKKPFFLSSLTHTPSQLPFASPGHSFRNALEMPPPTKKCVWKFYFNNKY